jgi:hypothetical protein
MVDDQAARGIQKTRSWLESGFAIPICDKAAP